MFLKLSADPEIDLNNDALLKFACFAKNSLLNKDGFSPFQLVHGSGPRISSLLENRPPALDCSTSSLAVANLTSALNLSRKAFLEADCSNRIRKALLANVRNDNGPFLQGQSVYYKKDGENRWRGPARKDRWHRKCGYFHTTWWQLNKRAPQEVETMPGRSFA